MLFDDIMTFLRIILVLLSFYGNGVCSIKENNEYKLMIRMPNVTSEMDDALMCHSAKLNTEEAYIDKKNWLAIENVVQESVDKFLYDEAKLNEKQSNHTSLETQEGPIYATNIAAADVHITEILAAFPRPVYKSLESDSQNYVCSDRETTGLVRFEPHASKSVAHHMMVYGCGEPGSRDPSWSCAAMDDHSNKSVCGDGERQIIWAWAMDADGRSFPQDVGFRVAGDTNIKYIIIQLHYSEKFQPGQTDDSGVTLHITTEKQSYQAGYYVLYTYGFIPPMTEEVHLESACTFSNNYTIYPLAYRTHSHVLGVVTSGYRVRNGQWTEIGRMSPQLPQTFYNATNDFIEVKHGDILASRCTMSSQRTTPTVIGPRHEDEMCNFYIMYYTDYPDTLQIEYCLRDAQIFHWSDYDLYPPNTASSIEGLPSFVRVDQYAENN